MRVDGSSEGSDATGLTHVAARGTLLTPFLAPLLMSTTLAAIAGFWVASVLGGLLAIVVVLALGFGATRFAAVRRCLAQRARREARDRREAARLAQLRPGGPVRQQQYIALRDLVEDLERTSPSTSRHFELQHLLEHFVRVAASLQRDQDALRRTCGGDLPQWITHRANATLSTRRRDISDRRLRHNGECLRRATEMADELDAIDELIRLIAQREGCSAFVPDDLESEVDRRLAELDDGDAAQLLRAA